MKKKTFYYSDECDEVLNIKRKTIAIDENYVYIKKNIFWKIGQFFVYQIIIRPFAYFYLKIKFHHKVVNKKILKKYKNTGYFMYGNHTLLAGDAFIPNIVNFPKNTKVIVHPDNISISATRWLIEMCGAIPIPSTLSASRNFINAIDYSLKKNNAIQVYPESHIWPYYTSIRTFPTTSFKYPIKFNTPLFVSTNTFKKRKFSKTPKVITYIDGPIFPDKNLNPKEQEEDLCNRVYLVMKERSKLSNYNFYTYIKEETDD